MHLYSYLKKFKFNYKTITSFERFAYLLYFTIKNFFFLIEIIEAEFAVLKR